MDHSGLCGNLPLRTPMRARSVRLSKCRAQLHLRLHDYPSNYSVSSVCCYQYDCQTNHIVSKSGWAVVCGPHEHDLVKFHRFLFLIFAFFNYYKYFLWDKFRHNCRATLTLKRFQKANSLILKKGAPQYEYRCRISRNCDIWCYKIVISLNNTLSR